MSTTTETAPAKEAYLEAFARLADELHDRPAVRCLRQEALARFEQVGFPGPRHEDWKFTNLAPLLRTQFHLPPAVERPTGERALPAGVVVMGLAEALEKHPDLVEPHLGRLADFRDQPFVALNTAFWRDGAFVYVPPGVVVEGPIQLGHLAASHESGPHLWYRRALVVLGRASQATVVEAYGGPDVQYATNTVVEVALADGARLDHYKVQEESPLASHLACTQAVLARDANFSTHYLGFGGALVRNEVRVRFDGENGEATVNGLYQAAGTQHMDNLTVIDHAMPHCASHELYKGVLDGQARGVFNGKIFVRQDAQKTDAKQTNQTLLLSDDATINTKPQLEIYADDVKCTHGATVGQLDEGQLFYLRSRGLGLEEARALLTFAFANDILSRVRDVALRARLEGKLLTDRRLPAAEDE